MTYLACTARVTGQHRTITGRESCPVCGKQPVAASRAGARPSSWNRTPRRLAESDELAGIADRLKVASVESAYDTVRRMSPPSSRGGSEDDDEMVPLREIVARRDGLSAEGIVEFLNDPARTVRTQAARNSGVTAQIANDAVRRLAAERKPDGYTLKYLMSRGDIEPETVAAAAMSPGSTVALRAVRASNITLPALRAVVDAERGYVSHEAMQYVPGRVARVCGIDPDNQEAIDMLVAYEDWHELTPDHPYTVLALSMHPNA